MSAAKTRFVSRSIVLVLSVSNVAASEFAASVTSGGSSSVTGVPCGATLPYEVRGVLSDNDTLGLAGFVCDLEFSGGPMGPADAPSADAMLNFDRPAGMTAGGGFGGTVVGGRLRFVGGAQNTTNNTPDNAPVPIGSVITGVGHAETVLVAGSVVTPAEPGTYTLSLSNLRATVLVGDDQATGYWRVEPAGVGTISNLTIEVLPAQPPASASNSGAACAGGSVTLLGGPDGMAGYSWTGPGGFTSTQQNPVLASAAPGIYTLTVTDANNCIRRTSTTVAAPLDLCAAFVDCNSNSIHDACEPDTDQDGIIDGCDNCPTVANPGQQDGDGDGIGNACENDSPTCDAGGPYQVAEGGTVPLSASASDPNQTASTLTYEWDLDGDGIYGETGEPANRGDETGSNPIFRARGLDGPSPVPVVVTLRVTDDGGLTAEATADVEVLNVNPTLLDASPGTQHVQYSDPIAPIVLQVSDVAVDVLTLVTTWSSNGTDFSAGLPGGLSLSGEGCSVADDMQSCTWTIAGNIGVPAGTYTIRVDGSDDDGGMTSTADVALVVEAEDAGVLFDEGNPLSVQVVAPGGNSGPFSLRLAVLERQPDESIEVPAAPGDISLATVTVDLVPVGPGGTVSGLCTPDGVVGTGYDAELHVTCAFDNVPVNTFAVETAVNVAGYYVGTGESVLVVFDPSLGFTTGGCWFYWPGSADPTMGYPGDKTHAGFSVKYTRKAGAKGSLLVIRRLADGSAFRLKSNAMTGLSVGASGSTPGFGWASFTGKATYSKPEWLEPLGNYTFITYIEDRGEPGAGADRFWVETKERDGLLEPDLSLSGPATENAVMILGGNIVVPHTPRR